MLFTGPSSRLKNGMREGGMSERENGVKAFSPDGTIDYEECPECLWPDVKVENGKEVEVVDGKAVDTGWRQRYYHCPCCGDAIVLIVE